MRKLLSLFILMVSMFIVVACQDEPELDIVTTEILNQIQIEFDEGDQIDHVTQNINLTISLDLFENVEITWITSDSNIITLNAGVGVVSRQTEDAEVTLTAEVKLNLDTKYKYFNLVVKAASSTDVPDEVAPVISGASDFNLALDSSAPDWLLGVSATDDVDGVVLVSADDSQVYLNTLGEYELTYAATDKAGNTSTVTVKVTVKADVVVDTTKPVITGTSDFELELGSVAPNYLAGVSATDDVDGAVLVSVDDSEVNLDVAGAYDLIYSATDTSNNTSIVIVTVTVIDHTISDDAETIVETFDNFTETGESYSDGSFIGVEDITWTYKGARGDQDLNNKAITFGGRISDNSSLKATIDGGIQSIALQYRKPFTSSQHYGIYINGIKIGEFIAVDSVQTFEKVLDTPITGTFELEIKPVSPGSGRAQITIDNLTWLNAPINKKPIEQQNAEFDRDDLNIQTTFIEDTTINFKTLGTKNSTITWKFVDGENPANTYVDLLTGVIAVPENGSVHVLVSANISQGTFSYSKIFNLILGEGAPVSIETIRSLNNSDYARTVGVITSLYSNSTTTLIFMQDESGAILAYVPNTLAAGLNIGDQIEVKASKNTDQNNTILNEIRGIKKLGTASIESLHITSDKLILHPARLVTVSGLISQAYGTDVTSYDLHSLNGTFTILIPSDLDEASKTLIQNKLSGIEAGTEVIITAPVMRIGNQYVLYVTHADELVVANSIFFNDVADIIKENHEIPNFGTTIESDLTLTNNSHLLFGATIAWSSSNQAVLSNTGVINRSTDPVSVTLTYTIYFDGEVVDTKSFNLTIASLSNYTGYYTSLANKSGAALDAAVRSLIKNTGRATGSTNQVKTVDNYNGQNYNIYTGFGAYGNREHVWPQSKLGSTKDDLHNLRAAVVSVNSSRSNYPFTNQVTGTEWQKIGSTFYPGSEHVGDVARIVLYVSIRYNLSLNAVGNLQMFLTWHEQDPVSDFEISRNGKIQNIQSNRNPFIDHPELVDVLFS